MVPLKLRCRKSYIKTTLGCLERKLLPKVICGDLDLTGKLKQWSMDVSLFKHAPQGVNLQPWIWPSEAWKRVHLDFAGPVEASMFC